MGCLTGIFVYPFRFLKWAFTNGWKGLAVLGVVIIIIVVGVFYIKSHVPAFGKTATTTTTTTTAAVTGLPSAKEAPFMVVTPTRYYYAFNAIKSKDGIVTLTTYWELINNEWIKRDTTLVIDKLFGEVKIKRR